MNLNVEIPDALAPALKAKADQQGVSASSYVRRVVEQVLSEDASLPGKPDKSTLDPAPAREIGGNRREAFGSGEEKARAFVRWAEGHRYTPPLSDEAISRASMYPDRW